MKIGRLICGENSHVPEPASNSPDSWRLAVPAEAVSEMLGKNAARAAPISALADSRRCSAARMSGRFWSRSEGKPAGTSATSLPSSGSPSGRSAGRLAPSSSVSALVSCATSRV
ncbi:hypothetical protein D3C72_1438900 [compost metagenome]